MLPQLDIELMHSSLSTIAAGTEAFGKVDTRGYDFCKILVVDGIPTAANTPDYFRIGDCDTAPTAFADCTALLTQGTDYTVAASSTTKANAYTCDIDLRGKDRYIGVGYESDATQKGVLIAILGRKRDGGAQSTVATTAEGVRNVLAC